MDQGSNGIMQQQLANLLEELFVKVHGFALDQGTSLCETITSITAEEASRPLAAGRTTIAAQTEHVCYYLDVLAEYMKGGKVEGVDWPGSWRRREVTSEEWDTLRRRVGDSYQRLVAQLEGFSALDTEERVTGIIAIVAHTAYHLGAIRQLATVVRG